MSDLMVSFTFLAPTEAQGVTMCVPTAGVMFTLVCGDSVQCGQEWRLPSRQTVILNLLTLTGHQDPLLWSRSPCARIVRCHQPLSRPLEIWELIVTRASDWSSVSHFSPLIGWQSAPRGVSPTIVFGRRNVTPGTRNILHSPHRC